MRPSRPAIVHGALRSSLERLLHNHHCNCYPNIESFNQNAGFNKCTRLKRPQTDKFGIIITFLKKTLDLGLLAFGTEPFATLWFSHWYDLSPQYVDFTGVSWLASRITITPR